MVLQVRKCQMCAYLVEDSLRYRWLNLECKILGILSRAAVGKNVCNEGLLYWLVTSYLPKKVQYAFWAYSKCIWLNWTFNCISWVWLQAFSNYLFTLDKWLWVQAYISTHKLHHLLLLKTFSPSTAWGTELVLFTICSLHYILSDIWLLKVIECVTYLL